jgi:DNA-binding FadR family transcriptional regulator
MSRPKSKTADITLEPLYKHSLRDRATEVIKRHVVEANLQPGASLPTERDLSKGLAVSRTVVREALAILETEGLVERRPSSGYYVTPAVSSLHIDSSEQVRRLLNEAAEVRLCFELGAVHLIMPKLTSHKIADLERRAYALDLAMDQQQAHAEAEIAFHQSMWTIAENNALVVVGRQILGDYFRTLALARPDCFVNPVDIGASRHLPIIEALCTYDITVVQAVMQDHCRIPEALRAE